MLCDMRYVFALVAAGVTLALAPSALAEGIFPKQPANGSTVSSGAKVEFTWDNPSYHVLGQSQVFYVATDLAFENVVFQKGDYCPALELCPQGAAAGPFAPGLYYWKVRLYAWDWNPDSDVWSFLSAAPPPLLPPPPPAPPPPPPGCRVPGVVGHGLPRATSTIRRAHCRVGQVSRSYSAIRRKGHVMAQRPRAGALLAAHARVNLVVSRGRRGQSSSR